MELGNKVILNVTRLQSAHSSLRAIALLYDGMAIERAAYECFSLELWRGYEFID